MAVSFDMLSFALGHCALFGPKIKKKKKTRHRSTCPLFTNHSVTRCCVF